MISYYKKISKEILETVFINNRDDYIDCVIFAKNIRKLKDRLAFTKTKIKEFPFISALSVKLNQPQIIEMAKIASVCFISKQAKVSAQIHVSKQIMGVNTFYKDYIFGKNITLAIIDTGINPHLDFVIPKNRIIKFVDLINSKKQPYDDNGHGTFVASIACGNGFKSGGKFSGVAPMADIVSIKALEKNGQTGAVKILEAMQWVFDNKKKYNIRVVCMSFGSSPMDKNDPLVVGAEALWNAGIVVVSAAGNSGPNESTIKSPGVSSKIITVGGLDDKRNDEDKFDIKNFKVADFSSRGPTYFGNFKPDLIAPSVDITGADYIGEYSKMSGTSVATPMIAGACLLILNKNSKLTPNQVKMELLRNCKKIDAGYNNDGFGFLNF